MVTKLENYENYSSRGIIYEDWLRVKEILSLVETGKILDIGCGEGSITSLILEKGLKTYGTEISMRAAKAAIKKNILVVRSDIEDSLPFKRASFDGIVAGEIIEHVMDTDYFLDEISRVLKPKGYAIITTPNVASIPSRLKLLTGKFYPASFSQGGEHVRFFTKKGFRELLISHGFRIDSLQTKPLIVPLLCRYMKIGYINVDASNFGERMIAKIRKQ